MVYITRVASDIGLHIAALRRSRHLSQRALGQLVIPRMQQARISALEHYPYQQRTVTIDTLERVAFALGCTVDIRIVPRHGDTHTRDRFIRSIRQPQKKKDTTT